MSATIRRIPESKQLWQGELMNIEHGEIETTLEFNDDDSDGTETMFASAAGRIREVYPGVTVRYSLANHRGGLFVWHGQYGVVLYAEIHYEPVRGKRVIRVYPMTLCQPHGYEQAALLFADKIGQRLHERYRMESLEVTCSSSRSKCHDLRLMRGSAGALK